MFIEILSKHPILLPCLSIGVLLGLRYASKKVGNTTKIEDFLILLVVSLGVLNYLGQA